MKLKRLVLAKSTLVKSSVDSDPVYFRQHAHHLIPPPSYTPSHVQAITPTLDWIPD